MRYLIYFLKQTELEQLKSSYQTKLKAEQEEMENKWAKRLR